MIIKECTMNITDEKLMEDHEIESTTAEDFEICELAQEIVESARLSAGVEWCKYMENEALRGLSHKMQLVLLHRIGQLFKHGTYTTTGVKHVDSLIEESFQKLSEDIKEYIDILRLGITSYALKMSNNGSTN